MREINIKDIENTDAALSLVWEVFLEYEAPEYSENGVNEFRKSINDEAYWQQLSFYGAYLDDTLVEVIATRNGGAHIALFFVYGKYHNQGIGRKLFETAKSNCTFAKMTVNSSPYAVEIFEKLGFCRVSAEQVVNGIRFTPMELKLF